MLAIFGTHLTFINNLRFMNCVFASHSMMAKPTM